MGDAVEPSEIFMNRERIPKEETSKVNPPIRFLARFFDYAIFFLAIWFVHRIIGGQFPFSVFDHWIPIEFFSWIPCEAFLLSTWATTPGKALLRVTIKHGRKKKLSFSCAIKRSFNVWFRGLGMGIPILNVFCMLIASTNLRATGMTTWDREDNIHTTHKKVSRIRLIFASIVTFIGFYLFYRSKHG